MITTINEFRTYLKESMDINTTFDEYMDYITIEDNGYIFGIWKRDNIDEIATFYVLDKNFNILKELPAFKNGKYTKDVLMYINNNTKLLVIYKNIDEIKEHFKLKYDLFIKAKKIAQRNKHVESNEMH